MCRVLKGGEEVRTDQRVEQVFDVMNGLLRRTPAAAAARLQARYYLMSRDRVCLLHLLKSAPTACCAGRPPPTPPLTCR